MHLTCGTQLWVVNHANSPCLENTIEGLLSGRAFEAGCRWLIDTKYYVERRARVKKWVVEYRGEVKASFDTKEEAELWGRRNYPGHGHESERVQVRENSPRGARRGEWM